MLRDSFHDVFIPHPVLKHLRWKLDEVSFHRCSREPSVISMRAKLMHNVTKLMEESYDIIMREQRWSLSTWLVEIAEHRSDCRNNFAFNFCSLQQSELSCVTIFMVSWV